MGKDGKLQTLNGKQLCQRVKRVERVCLLLGISTLLLAIVEIRQFSTVGQIIGSFEFLLEQLDLISQQIDAITQGVQSLH